MKIYVGHSKSFDFQKDLYNPIKRSSLAGEHTFIFPHEQNTALFDSKELFQNGCDLVIAEVSYPATGLGIELGWADMLGIPVVCIYKSGEKISGSLKSITNIFLEYSDTEDLVVKVAQAIHSH